jgi:hypothetical protein
MNAERVAYVVQHGWPEVSALDVEEPNYAPVESNIIPQCNA